MDAFLEATADVCACGSWTRRRGLQAADKSSKGTLGAYQPNIFEIYEQVPDMALSGTY